MKKINLLALVLIATFASCQNEWYEETTQTEPIPLTYEQEFAVVNNYTTIDTINNCYAVAISDEIMQNERLTKNNVELIMQEIGRINRKILDQVDKGIVTTLTLKNCYGFKSYTANMDKSEIKFADTYENELNMASTRGGYVGGMSFNDGNWYDYSDTFEASDHVTSKLSVIASGRYYWSVSVVCNTGTSAYGNRFSVTGYSSMTNSTRFWWWTGGGSAPFIWTFEATAPVGGDAQGSFSITNTN